MKRSDVIAINHKRNTEAALTSLNNDLDSKPPSKGDKLLCFSTASKGRVRKLLKVREFLQDKLDEMFQVDPSLNHELHYDIFGDRIRCADCDITIPMKVKVRWGKGRWLCEPCYDKQFG